MAPSPCPVGSKIQIEKEKLNPASATPNEHSREIAWSLEEAQAYLDRWETGCADTRIHGTTKRQVAAMFAEEKPALLPLPLEPFRYYPACQAVRESGRLRRGRRGLLRPATGWDRTR